jgi:hypothetical protein
VTSEPKSAETPDLASTASADPSTASDRLTEPERASAPAHVTAPEHTAVGPEPSPARDPEPAPAAASSRDGRAAAAASAPAWAALAPQLAWPPSGGAIAVATGAALVLLAILWGAFGGDDKTDALALRIALLETQLRQVAEKPLPPAADPRQVADLATRLAAAEQAMQRLDGSVTAGQSRLQETEARVAKVESAPAPVPAAPDPALSRRLGEADAALKQMADRVATLEAALKPVAAQASSNAATDEGLSARTAAAEAALKTMRGELETLARTVNEAAQSARAAEQRAAIAAREATSGADRAVRLAVAATALRDVLVRGEPYAAELAAARPLASDPGKVAPLEPFAASGVPSAAALARELSGLVPTMVAAAAPPRGDGGMLDRLQQSAERFVRVRPVNETPGDDPLPVIARIEARAAAGQLDAARAEIGKLPEAARAPAQAWSQTVEKRAAALAAAQSLARDSVAALAK